MSTQPLPAVPVSGLPPGVSSGPLGRRFVAHLVDSVIPALIATATTIITRSTGSAGGAAVVSIVGALLVAGWLVLVWSMFAVRAAGPGMRLMKLQLVGLRDGRPIGWTRFFVRQLVLAGLTVTGIGLLLMVIFLVRNNRKQGWHDRAAVCVVIRERRLAPVRAKPTIGVPARRAAEGASKSALPSAKAAPQRAARSGPVPPAKWAAGNGTKAAPGSASKSAEAPIAAPLVPPHPSEAAAQAGPDDDAIGPPVDAGDLPITPGAAPDDVPPAPEDPLVAPEDLAAAPDRAPEDSAGAPVTLVGPSISPDGPPAALDSGPALPTEPRAPTAVGPLDQGWVAVLDDGREINLQGLVLLGRSPQGRPGEDDAELIKVADETRTVSKTHLSLGVDDDGLHVTDRNSTNGSTLTSPGGVSVPCLAGDIVSVTEGTIISFGDHWLRVERR